MLEVYINLIMKKYFYTFIVCLFSLVGWGWEGNDNIMMWQVNDTGNTVDGGPNDVYTFLGIDHSDDYIGVRIACYDKDGTFIKYLNPVYPEEWGGIDWEYNDEFIGTRDDLPATLRQAYYGPNDYSEKLFQMQVGNYDGDDNFIPLLYSSKSEVAGRYWYDDGQLAPQYGEWTPTDFYTYNSPIVPEPSSTLLAFIGICFLGLKRKIP